MKKHDILSLLLFLLAAAGAGAVYKGYALYGQIAYTIAAFSALGVCKAKAAPFQVWSTLIICLGFGYTTGDWMHSVAVTCGMLAINLRGYMMANRTYSSNTWQEPVLGVVAMVVYVVSNLMHDNHWQGWVFPAPIVLFGFLMAPLGYKDRQKVRQLISNGLIEIGSTAPDFSLTSHEGRQVNLSDFKGSRELLLLFLRGDWCPSCHIMLRTYEKNRDQFQSKNIMLCAIGPDPVGVNKAMVEKLGVDFAVLSDEDLAVSKKYCVQVQDEAAGSGMEQGVPLPASFLVDKQGIVRYTSRANNAGEFLRPDVIFEVLAKL